eukprot:NODE_9127_length_487_cov_3.819635_g8049_i0.p4 GENE.NODE_9127_length_487_cov_3.819635_g8049_i0~~NODE_9127_length_487_cov_3.819635_g8049_i0.p4  ORF type:complete len:56 (-),score=4.06 NODE_9127_length_487_cov_3.819635_g8049_i0:140-307(-)
MSCVGPSGSLWAIPAPRPSAPCGASAGLHLKILDRGVQYFSCLIHGSSDATPSLM